MRGEDDFHSLKIIDFVPLMISTTSESEKCDTRVFTPEALSLRCSRRVGHSSEDVRRTLCDDSAPHAVDMWSLGCIFLEICAGFPLWFGYKSKVGNGTNFTGFVCCEWPNTGKINF